MPPKLETKYVANTASPKLLFKTPQESPEELQALIDANTALRLRMDKIVRHDQALAA